jgi:ABC-type Fe3+-hydroxamate transport system substrate-binding protein
MKPEWLLSANPDYIVVGGDAATFLKDSRFAPVTAFKKVQVMGLAPNLVTRRGYHLEEFITKVTKGVSLLKNRK